MAIIHTVNSTTALAQAAATHIRDLVLTAVQTKGHFTLALSGGSTPLPTYQQLASPPFRDHIPWENVHIYWSDERAVAPDDEDSNFHAAYQALIEPLSLPEENIHRIPGEKKPQQAAEEYEHEIRQAVEGDPPRFDLILLGMGSDGHTASLFPHTAAVQPGDGGRLVVANYVEDLNAWRITFTPLLINAAAQITFLVSGEEKAQPVYQVLAGRHQPQKLPAQLIKPEDGTLIWFLDQDAAKYLHRG